MQQRMTTYKLSAMTKNLSKSRNFPVKFKTKIFLDSMFQYFIGNIHVISGKLNKENQQYILHLSSHLLPGNKYTLEIDFDGNISESLQGLHENSYVTNDGNKK